LVKSFEEHFEGLVIGLMGHDPATNHRRVSGRCAMFGSVWQARGQQHNKLLHPRVLELVFGVKSGWSRGRDKGDAVKGVYVKGERGVI
jgi:hypothetical protein